MKLTCIQFSLWFIGVLPTAALGQRPAASVSDSLLHYLRVAKQDTTYVRAANQYAWWLINYFDDLDQADSLLNQTESLARRLKYPLGLGRVYFNQGRVYQRRPEPENIARALTCFQKAYQVAQQAQLPPTEVQRALTGIGESYVTSNQAEKGLPYLLRAIQLTERYKLTDYVTQAYGLVGNVLYETGNQQRANAYYQKQYVQAQSEQDKGLVLAAEERLIARLGEKGDYRLALSHLQKALGMADQYGNLYWKILFWIDLAHCYRRLGQPKLALQYLKRAERYAPIDKPQSQLSTSLALGDYYASLGHYAKAEPYYRQALTLAVELVETPMERVLTMRLARVYQQTRQLDKAHPYLMRLLVLNDSLYSAQTAVRLRDLETKHEKESRENQIKLLHQQTQSAQFERNSFLIGGLLLLVLGVAISAWLLNRSRLRRLSEALTLRQQIAHDLHDEMGSTLSSISLLSSMSNDLLHQAGSTTQTPELVQRMVAKIFTDTRQMQQTIDELIWTIKPGDDSLAQIAARLQAYAEPLLSAKGIAFQLVFDSALEHQPVSLDIRRNLYLLGKEAVTNVVKYAQPTQVMLHFEYGPNQLTVLIEDDGRGYDPAVPTTRTGLHSMRQRALAMGGSLTIRSAPGQGTSLRLTVVV